MLTEHYIRITNFWRQVLPFSLRTLWIIIFKNIMVYFVFQEADVTNQKGDGPDDDVQVRFKEVS